MECLTSARLIPVLFTCAGQRVDIVTAFKRAGATTVAADLDPLAPAVHHADASVALPRVADPDYLPAIAEAVGEHGIELVVPLSDLDQRLLAVRRDELEALVLLPGVDVVDRTRDKHQMHLFLEERGLESPPTWLPGDLPEELPFPVLVKSREGFGSNHIYRALDRSDLDFFLAHTPVESVVQRACSGEEFSIDVFSDLDGRCLNAIPRTMIQSKGGESIKGMTLRDPDLIEIGRRVAETVGVAGPATIQCFRTAEGRHEITDVNLRFGGAFPLPLAAGSCYPELALTLARGVRPEPRVGSFREGVVMTRFFSHLALVAGEDGTLEPFSEELPEPIVSDE
jgi:carbamoyl-phosphate synthase large subunit